MPEQADQFEVHRARTANPERARQRAEERCELVLRGGRPEPADRHLASDAAVAKQTLLRQSHTVHHQAQRTNRRRTGAGVSERAHRCAHATLRQVRQRRRRDQSAERVHQEPVPGEQNGQANGGQLPAGDLRELEEKVRHGLLAAERAVQAAERMRRAPAKQLPGRHVPLPEDHQAASTAVSLPARTGRESGSLAELRGQGDHRAAGEHHQTEPAALLPGATQRTTIERRQSGDQRST